MSRVSARLHGRSTDSGLTLVELIVAISLLAVVLVIVTAMTALMYNTVNHGSSLSTAQDQSRVAIEAIDKQVRYANAITTPGTGTDGGYYVEWETGNDGQQNYCSQWRYEPSTELLQSRTWPVEDPGVTPTPSSWATVASHILPPTSGNIFSLAQPDLGSTTDVDRQSLTLDFRAQGAAGPSGHGPVTVTSHVTLTAANTTSDAVTANVCDQVGRP